MNKTNKFRYPLDQLIKDCKTDKASEEAKILGFSSLKELSELSGVPRSTLNNQWNNNKALFYRAAVKAKEARK